MAHQLAAAAAAAAAADVVTAEAMCQSR